MCVCFVLYISKRREPFSCICFHCVAAFFKVIVGLYWFLFCSRSCKRTWGKLRCFCLEQIVGRFRRGLAEMMIPGTVSITIVVVVVVHVFMIMVVMVVMRWGSSFSYATVDSLALLLLMVMIVLMVRMLLLLLLLVSCGRRLDTVTASGRRWRSWRCRDDGNWTLPFLLDRFQV